MNIYKLYNKPKELEYWDTNDPENTGKIEQKNGIGMDDYIGKMDLQ